MHSWELIPGKLWQSDLYGSVSLPAECVVTCAPLSEVPAVLGDICHGRPLHVLFPFMDREELPDMDVAGVVAALAAACVSRGGRVVVNCNAGRNRSGLLAALVMHRLGLTGILATIQTAHPQALYNPVFATYVRGLG